MSRKDNLNELLESSNRSKDNSTAVEWILNKFPFPKSAIFKTLMRSCGLKVGREVRILGRVKFKIRGKASNIIIGDQVVLGKNVDLRNRENGIIELKTGVYLDSDVRLVAARNGFIKIGEGSELGANTIINSGGETTIGRFCLFAGFININSSSHGISKNQFIKSQPHEHGFVTIADDVWVGAYAAVLMNTSIGEGVVVGSHSVVKGEIPDFGICVGVPGKVIKYRE